MTTLLIILSVIAWLACGLLTFLLVSVPCWWQGYGNLEIDLSDSDILTIWVFMLGPVGTALILAFGLALLLFIGLHALYVRYIKDRIPSMPTWDGKIVLAKARARKDRA